MNTKKINYKIINSTKKVGSKSKRKAICLIKNKKIIESVNNGIWPIFLDENH